MAMAATIQVSCGKSNACYPWDTFEGPACGRGDRMNLRFSLDLSMENEFLSSVYQETMTSVTYAQCPVVDQLQAITLRFAAALAVAKISNNTNITASTVTVTRGTKTQYLSAFGFGSVDNRLFPNLINSTGIVMVADNSTSNPCPLGSIAFTPFLVLSVAMRNGLFNYVTTQPQPLYTGFTPTCDSTNICLTNPALACIGHSGARNCAVCLASSADIAKTDLQVWISYSGTDRFGRQLRSSGSNPLNFRAFAGTSVYNKVLDAVSSLEKGAATGLSVPTV